MIKTGIYKITSPSNKIYIGQALNIYKRWEYSYKKLFCKSQPKLYNSFLKYGVENHTFEIVKECEPKELNYYERHYQEYFETIGENGLNCILQKCDGKAGEYSDHTKKKMSNSGKIKTFSVDHRKKISESNKKRFSNESERKKLSDKMKGRKRDISVIIRINVTKKLKRELLDKKIENVEKEKKKISKMVINIENGLIYESILLAWKASGVKYSYFNFCKKLKGKLKNNTPFVYY